MKNRDTLVNIARQIEYQARQLKAFIPENVHQKEIAERETITYAGVMLSMASSVLCELYQETKPDFSIMAVNGILREWGADELA